MRLRDKVAIVTAAGRGIGHAIALCLAKEGANMVVNSFHEETTTKVADEIKAMGRRTLAIAGDITPPDMVYRVIEGTIDTFGRIDILVNNVGGGPLTRREYGDNILGKLEVEWDGMYQQNLKAPVMMCQLAAGHFIAQKSGKIINIASVAGLNTYNSKTSPVSYRAVKAGLIRYTQSLADELGPYNVNVNCICPGYVYTPNWQRSAQRMVETRP